MITMLKRNWWTGLTAILALYYLGLGVMIGGLIGLAAILGVILIAGSLVVRSRSTRLASVLLVVGSLPLALLTWWSVITPVLATLVLICGGLAMTRMRQTPSVGTY